jgi:predicted HAD superfamily hydrolase
LFTHYRYGNIKLFTHNRYGNINLFAHYRYGNMDFYRTSSLKQEAVDKHVAPIGHIILIAVCLAEKQQIAIS